MLNTKCVNISGTSQEAEIACIAVDAFLIYTAVGSVVKSFARKGREVTSL